MATQQYDKVMARFRPNQTNNLYEYSKSFIGKKCEWQALWIIEDGEYKGQWAMHPLSNGAEFGWAPECDLEVI